MKIFLKVFWKNEISYYIINITFTFYTFYEYKFFKIWICSSAGFRASDCIQNNSLWRIKTMFQVFKSSNLYIVSNQRVEGSNPSRSAKIKFFEILVAEEEGYIYCIEEVIPKRCCNSLDDWRVWKFNRLVVVWKCIISGYYENKLCEWCIRSFYTRYQEINWIANFDAV